LGLYIVCSVCEQRGVLYTDNILDFKYPGIGANILSMALGGIVFLIVTLLMEQSFFVHKLLALFLGQTATRAEIYLHDVRHIHAYTQHAHAHATHTHTHTRTHTYTYTYTTLSLVMTVNVLGF